jgi:hypothetical protein
MIPTLDDHVFTFHDSHMLCLTVSWVYFSVKVASNTCRLWCTRIWESPSLFCIYSQFRRDDTRMLLCTNNWSAMTTLLINFCDLRGVVPWSRYTCHARRTMSMSPRSSLQYSPSIPLCYLGYPQPCGRPQPHPFHCSVCHPSMGLQCPSDMRVYSFLSHLLNDLSGSLLDDMCCTCDYVCPCIYVMYLCYA